MNLPLTMTLTFSSASKDGKGVVDAISSCNYCIFYENPY